MNRYGFTGRVHPQMIDEYRRRHDAIWPELVDAIRASGIRNYSIFLRPDGLLYGYYEAEDSQRSLAQVSATEVSKRWQAEMASFFEIPEGRTPEESFEYLSLAFHLD